MAIRFEINNKLIKINPLDIILLNEPAKEEILKNKVNILIDKYLAYAKALGFVPSSLAKAIAYQKIEFQLFSNILALFFIDKPIDDTFTNQLCNQLNAFYGQNILAKITKVCSTGNFFSCRIFIPENPPAHLYAVAYLLVDYLLSNQKLEDFDLEQNLSNYRNLYDRAKIFAENL
jgi:hypothetical protein